MRLPGLEHCTGCGTCVAICPAAAISLVRTDNGFDYPQVDHAKCLGCSLCENRCPVLKPGEVQTSIGCFAAVLKDRNDLAKSTSGGVFTALYRRVLAVKGVVFGCVWAENHRLVRHLIGKVEDVCASMRGSKYVQGAAGQSFAQVKQALDKGLEVLFTGTPCQIAGLKRFLGREYENLLAVEVVCHGVGSPGLWQRYCDELERRYGGKIQQVGFRTKGVLPSGSAFTVTFDNGKSLTRPAYSVGYSRAFLQGLCLRPSCHACPFKNGRSGADVAIGDFWGVEHFHPELDRTQGCSAVVCFTERGRRIVEDSGLMLTLTTWENVTAYNKSLVAATPLDRQKVAAFQMALERGTVAQAVAFVMDGPWYRRFPKYGLRYARMTIGRFLRKVGLR